MRGNPHSRILARRFEDVFKICLKDISSASLQRNNFSSSKTSWTRLEDALQMRLEDVLKTSWKMKNCYAEDVLKTSWRHVLEDEELLRWRHLEGVLKTCLKNILETNKMFTNHVSNHGLLTNLNQYLTDLYLTNLYSTNLKRTQNALTRTR